MKMCVSLSEPALKTAVKQVLSQMFALVLCSWEISDWIFSFATNMTSRVHRHATCATWRQKPRLLRMDDYDKKRQTTTNVTFPLQEHNFCITPKKNRLYSKYWNNKLYQVVNGKFVLFHVLLQVDISLFWLDSSPTQSWYNLIDLKRAIIVVSSEILEHVANWANSRLILC